LECVAKFLTRRERHGAFAVRAEVDRSRPHARFLDIKRDINDDLP
jgi:hypothetical protein